jgi:hypothetical protein
MFTIPVLLILGAIGGAGTMFVVDDGLDKLKDTALLAAAGFLAYKFLLKK